MTPAADVLIPIVAAAAALLLVWAAEALHQRRCRVVARLATGPTGRPRRWVRGVRPLKTLAIAAMTWALVTMAYCGGGIFDVGRSDPKEDQNVRHVVFLADLSPSMTLQDAGPKGESTRAERADAVVDGVLKRLDGDVVFSVFAFYTDAMPVVADAHDPELVRNVFGGLPLWCVMEPGKTDLGTGVRGALEQLADYPAESTTVFICTDGDTIELGPVPKPPESVREAYILGVGNPHRGTFIDDHMSRQDAATLRDLAGRLGGRYIDVNEKHVGTLALGDLAVGAGGGRSEYDLVDVAIAVFVVAAAVCAAIPILLEYFGSDWRTVRSASPAPRGRPVRESRVLESGVRP